MAAMAPLVLAAILASGAAAFFTATGTGNASAATGALVPATSVAGTQSGTGVNVSWQAAQLSNGRVITGYYLVRVKGATQTPACGSSATQLLAANTTSCTDTGNPSGQGVPAGTYTYIVTAVAASWTATSSPSSSVTVAGPTITSVSPANVDIGASQATVTITGSNFGSGATVAFSASGLTISSVTVVNATTITAKVSAPTGTALGAGGVTVTNRDGDSATGTFSVLAAPTVTAISPSLVNLGTTNQIITVTGTGFEPGAIVSFSASAIMVNSSTYVSSTQMTANVTVAAAGPVGSSNATVTNPDGSVATGGTLQVGAVPTITSITPVSALAGSTVSVVVSGSGFDTGAQVTFSGSGVSGTTAYNSSTSLTVTTTLTASAALTTRNVTVTDGDGQATTLTNGGFTVVAHPAASLYSADSTAANVGVFGIGSAGLLTQAASATAQAGPQGVTVTPDGRYVYVANCTANTISQYSAGPTGALTPLSTAAVTTSGTCPRGDAVSTSGKYLYVAENGTNSGASGKAVQWFSIGAGGLLTSVGSIATNLTSPSNLALTPDGNALFVTNATGTNGAGAGTIAEFSIGTSGTLTASGTVAAGTLPFGIAVSPDGRYAYATNQTGATISEYTVTNDLLSLPTTLATGAAPSAVAVSPDARSVYVVSTAANAVFQYTIGPGGLLTAKTTASVTSASAPSALALTPDGQYAYTGAASSGAAGVFNQYAQASAGLTALSPASLTSSVNTGPYALAVDEPMQIGTPATLTNAVAGTAYSAALWTLSGTAPVSYTLTTGSLPAGLSFSGGALSGTPTAAGTFTFTVTATDSSTVAQTASRQFTLTVLAPPTQVVSLASASSAAMNGTTVYFNGTKAGSLQLKDTVTANSTGATAASATFPAITATGWTHAAETITTPSGGPFTSSTLSWTASAAAPAGFAVTGTDSNGLTVATPLSFVSDTTAPLNGALTVNSVAATAGGSSSSAIFAFSISRTDYAETQTATASGLASSVLTVQSFAITNYLTAACATTPSGPVATAVTVTGTTQPSQVTANYCYRYTLTGTDNVGNATSISTTVAWL